MAPFMTWHNPWNPKGWNDNPFNHHYSDVIMNAMSPQITSLTTVYSTVYWGTDQRKHQSSAWLDFVRGIHRWPVNSPHKGPVTRKMLQFEYVIMHWRKENSGKYISHHSVKVLMHTPQYIFDNVDIHSAWTRMIQYPPDPLNNLKKPYNCNISSVDDNEHLFYGIMI